MRKIIMICLALIAAVTTDAQNSQTALRKLQMAEYAISKLYVDSVDDNKLVEEAIIKMLAQLDPHSTYNNAEEVKAMNEPLQGNFDGIGVQFQMVEDTLLVIQPVSDGPSEKAGIIAGDRIVAVNDSAIAGVRMSNEDIQKCLRGPKGTKVNLSVIRRGIKDLLKFEVKRDRIPLYSIDASYMIRPEIGYIKISRFAISTGEEFTNAVGKLKALGMKDMILDLQGNGGGFLNAAIDIANEFLEQKDLIVYTEGRAERRSNFLAKGDGKFKDGRLVVLIDEYSASASEIVTGAIQDWDRGVVVGRRTFGKGLVQRPIDLPDNSMIRLTIARYYTPSGRCIQKPWTTSKDNDGNSVEVNMDDYNSDILKRYKNGELMHADSIHFPDSLKFKTNVLGRTIYGGGGIMPDYFVPIDTTSYTNLHRLMVAKGTVNKTIAKYVENNRKQLTKRYRNLDAFCDEYSASGDILGLLRSEAEKAGITIDEDEYNKSLPLLTMQLKGLVARDLWDIGAYYRIMNETNDSVTQAVKIITEGHYDELITK